MCDLQIDRSRWTELQFVIPICFGFCLFKLLMWASGLPRVSPSKHYDRETKQYDQRRYHQPRLELIRVYLLTWPLSICWHSKIIEVAENKALSATNFNNPWLFNALLAIVIMVEILTFLGPVFALIQKYSIAEYAFGLSSSRISLWLHWALICDEYNNITGPNVQMKDAKITTNLAPTA